MIEVGDIVSIITITGEYVGKCSVVKSGSITLERPVMVMATEQGMGFAGSLAMTGEENPKEATFYNVSHMTKTNSQVEAAYRQHTSGLITQPNPGLIV
jgi:hypothetical protein